MRLCAHAGLRTLVFGAKYIVEDEYQAWAKAYLQAELDTEDRDGKMEVLADQMEQDFEVLGCTAVEDKLQEDVPDTIMNLKQAGIKVWVLTGDKLETASQSHVT